MKLKGGRRTFVHSAHMKITFIPSIVAAVLSWMQVNWSSLTACGWSGCAPRLLASALSSHAKKLGGGALAGGGLFSQSLYLYCCITFDVESLFGHPLSMVTLQDTLEIRTGLTFQQACKRKLIIRWNTNVKLTHCVIKTSQLFISKGWYWIMSNHLFFHSFFLYAWIQSSSL